MPAAVATSVKKKCLWPASGYGTLKRLIIHDAGQRADDMIPKRFFEEPLKGGGPSGGAVVEREKFETILEEYYEDRKFDHKTSLQTRAGLERLSLKEIAEDLEARGMLAG